MSNRIKNCAAELTRSCQTHDPYKICAQLGIDVRFKDIGSLSGFYSVIKGQRFIVINEKLSEIDAATVCAHELGHDRLHSELARDSALRDVFLFQMNSKCEYEANLFAAELLIDKEELEEYIGMDYGTEQICRAMKIDENLICIMLKENYGKSLISGYDPKFLKKQHTDF
jgi:Zn-dependent peptidase ImmA (M78 family)